jgi:tetratricopeptide (TPR) repeat protein
MRMVYRLYLAALAISLLLAAPGAAMARQDDPSLDGLFQRLKTVEDPVAAQALQEAIWQAWVFSPEREETQLMLQGIRAMQERRLQDALAIFTELCRQAPNFAEAWNKRATVNWLLDDYDASVADIGRTLALEPRHWGALSGLGMIETERGNYAAAVRAYERALDVNPHLSDMRLELERLRKILRDRET